MQQNISYNLVQNAPILIVEPDKSMRVKIAKAFQRSGLRLISVGTGEDALNIIRGLGIPALAIIDMTLPDMSGLELANRLHQAKSLPIIMSGYNISSDIVASILDLIAEDFVHKPYDEQELTARVYRILLRTSSVRNTDEQLTTPIRRRDFTKNSFKLSH